MNEAYGQYMSQEFRETDHFQLMWSWGGFSDKGEFDVNFEQWVRFYQAKRKMNVTGGEQTLNFQGTINCADHMPNTMQEIHSFAQATCTVCLLWARHCLRSLGNLDWRHFHSSLPHFTEKQTEAHRG